MGREEGCDGAEVSTVWRVWIDRTRIACKRKFFAIL